jgi:hypothetical protein
MERPLIALVAAAAALGLSANAVAQGRAQQPPSQEPPSAQATQVSDAEIETFAAIYVDLQQTSNKYKAEMTNAQTDEQAREVQTRMQEESIATVEKRGWTPDQYVAVAEAINSDATLTEKTLRLIEQ